MRRAIMLAVAVLASTGGVVQADSRPPAEAPLFDPITGYRMSHYRGVIPSIPEGVRRVDVAQAHALWQAGAIFIDVNPAPGALRDVETGRWSLAEPHASIPGAHWFAESGRGELDPGIEQAMLLGVRRLAARHPHRPLVVFCQADCWMSWNAALRLHRAGLPDIRWFADGLDGWKEAGFAVTLTVPEG